MFSNYTALLDACVLYPAPLRDLLVTLGGTGLFRARWTDQIHEEWIGALLKSRPDLRREKLERTRKNMDAAVPDCLVSGYEELIEGLRLPDANDRHVLAAAIRAHASVIVTVNLKDFPESALEPYGIEAQHPDDFLRYQHGLNPALMLSALREQRARLVNPRRTPQEFLANLGKTLPLTVDALGNCGDFI